LLEYTSLPAQAQVGDIMPLGDMSAFKVDPQAVWDDTEILTNQSLSSIRDFDRIYTEPL